MPGAPERTLIVPPGDAPKHSLAEQLLLHGAPVGYAEPWLLAWLAAIRAYLARKGR